mgnify:CR=1 FL=1
MTRLFFSAQSPLQWFRRGRVLCFVPPGVPFIAFLIFQRHFLFVAIDNSFCPGGRGPADPAERRQKCAPQAWVPSGFPSSLFCRV